MGKPCDLEPASALNFEEAQALLEKIGEEGGGPLAGLRASAKQVVEKASPNMHASAGFKSATASAGELASAEARLAHGQSQIVLLETKVQEAHQACRVAEEELEKARSNITALEAKVMDVRARMLMPADPSNCHVDHLASLFEAYMSKTISEDDMRRALQTAQVAARPFGQGRAGTSPVDVPLEGGQPARQRAGSEQTVPEQDDHMQGNHDHFHSGHARRRGQRSLALSPNRGQRRERNDDEDTSRGRSRS